MRLKASPGILLLGLGACAHLPGNVRIEVDGSTVEFKKDANAAPAAPQAEPPAPEAAPPAADDQPR